jgi:3-hydroxyisobutyrate dehydrogenase-like beta-hydroxyacid dehydrogenase
VAADVAHAVAGYRFSRVYVDANAVSPQTARQVGAIIEQGGATFVDGGIIGPPARLVRSTRLYLSGPAAQQIASLFKDGPLEVIVFEGGAGAASALKVAFASYTKGTMAGSVAKLRLTFCYLQLVVFLMFRHFKM